MADTPAPIRGQHPTKGKERPTRADVPPKAPEVDSTKNVEATHPYRNPGVHDNVNGFKVVTH